MTEKYGSKRFFYEANLFSDLFNIIIEDLVDYWVNTVLSDL